MSGKSDSGEILIKFYCGTDPLPNLCLVPLWKDVNVRLKRTGLDDSFVSGGNKQRRNTDEDREQLLILAGGKLKACSLLILDQLTRYHYHLIDTYVCMTQTTEILGRATKTENDKMKKRFCPERWF